MTLSDEQLLAIYKGEFAIPKGITWNKVKAAAYRQALLCTKDGVIARWAAIGSIPMGAPGLPDSFPFIQFSGENVEDEELLKRGALIRNAMNKYDPYSTEPWEPIVLRDSRGEKISYDKLKYRENMIADGPTPKDPVVEYLKSLPPTPGPKMRIKSDAKSFTDADYSPDTLFSWIDGEITGNPTMLEIHHAIKRAAGDYLLTLYEEHRNRKIETMRLIDYEILQNLSFGTEGKYVNRYSMKSALAALAKLSDGPKKVSRLLKNQIELDEDDYVVFNPVIGVDNKGFQKWKKYADNKRKRYNYFMSVLSKSVVKTDSTKKVMKNYDALNLEAAARRAAIDAIQRVKAARAAPTPSAAPLAFAASVSNAAAIQAQNDAVDQFIRDVKAMTSKADLNQYLSTTGVIDTSLLPNESDRQNEMGQAVLDKEAELNAQPPPPQQPPSPPDYANMPLDEVSKLSEQDIDKNFTVPMLRKLLGYDVDNISKAQKKAFTNEKFFLKDELIKKVQAKDIFDAAKANKDKQRYEDSKTYAVGTCVKYDGNEIGTIVSLDLDNRKVGVEKYNGDGTAVTKNMDDVSVLTSADCAQLKGNIDFLIQQSVDKREEEERKEKEEQDRLAAKEAAEEAKKKAAEEAAKEAKKKAAEDAIKAKQKRLKGYPKLKVEKGIGGWFPLKLDGKTLFYAASPSAITDIKLKDIPKNEHLIQYDNVEADKDGAYKIKGTTYVIKDRNKIKGSSLLVTKNYGIPLKDSEIFKVRKTSLGEIRKIKDQAIEAIEALHAAGIVHQDIKLDNMVWDGQNLTVIDLGNAKMLNTTRNKPCTAQYNGEIIPMNIFPPPELADPKLADYWSLVLALLNLGGKNLQPPDDVATGGGSSSISEALFTFGGRKKGKCYEVGADRNQNGLLFIKNADLTKVTTMRQAQINALVNREGEEGHVLFEYLWFVFMKKDTVEDKSISNDALNGLIPGFGKNPTLENNNLMEFLTSQMPEKREDMAKRWVQGHLQWKTLQAKLKGKKIYTATQAKILNPETNDPKFISSTFEDLGKKFYGIPTNTVIEIFKMLTSKFPSIAQSVDLTQSVDLSEPANLLDLDYDSFSDAELDEFEASLEPYDEEELDKLMEGALTGMAKEAYDSSSDSSRPSSVSYNSSSDTGLSETALSYDSSSDGGSGAALSYNSESEQSFHNSEHGASYDSDSDEDR